MTEDTIKKLCYTKEEVDSMVAAALAGSKTQLMKHLWRKHNRDATIISMILGFTMP